VTGSLPGSTFVSGDRYIGESFDYYYSHLWRNYGILIAYLIFFVVAYGLAVEFVPQVEKGRGDILIFLRRRKPKLEHNLQEKEKSEEDIETGQFNALTSIEPISASPMKLHKLDRKEANFTWRSIEYEIPLKSGTKVLLTGISGHITHGTMTGKSSFYHESHITDFAALMGESGTGKTTLLNVLAQRVHVGTVRGDISLNGSALDHTFWRQIGYVESQDIHLSQFTVRETLRLSAQLRQPQGVSRRDKNNYAEKVIAMLEMEAYSDAVVGVPGSGLSLEQRKKLTVSTKYILAVNSS
jgi:ATP-binding cassette subfamily G (WHITE) protein 2 (PDR)